MNRASNVARRAALFTVLLLVCALPLAAGVVYEIEVKDHEGSPGAESTEMMVEGKNLKMGVRGGQKGGRADMIFRGDRREMVVIDHDDKSYVVIDEAAIAEIKEQLAGAGGQIAEAMKEMEKHLENVPEDQREMVEKMLKRRMPEGMGGPALAPVPTEVRKSGERASKAGYPAVRYDVYRGDEKVREMWVTDWNNVEGADEVRDAFLNMADFVEDMVKSFQSAMGPMGGVMGGVPSVFDGLREMDGFPVVTRSFEGGELEEESVLRSASRRTLDPAEFEPPAGYKRRSMGPQ